MYGDGSEGFGVRAIKTVFTYDGSTDAVGRRYQQWLW